MVAMADSHTKKKTAQFELKMGQREQNTVWAGSLSFTNDESVNKRGS